MCNNTEDVIGSGGVRLLGSSEYGCGKKKRTRKDEGCLWVLEAVDFEGCSFFGCAVFYTEYHVRS